MNKRFLKNYLQTNSPSTFEVDAQEVWKDYMSNFTSDFIIDNYGSIAAIIKSKSNLDKPYKVVIEAHCDEVNFMVRNITDNGLIYISVVGIDASLLPGISVNIMGSKGLVKGFFGWPPAHLNHGDDKITPSAEKMFIDVGASNKEEVSNMGIEIGDFIVFDRKPEITDTTIISKSLDDKIGGFIIAEVVKELNEKNIELPFDLYVVNAVQEEVGLRGAKMITDTIKPDVAICIDVCHDTSNPLLNKSKVGDYKIGEGIVLSQAPAIHRNLLNLMKKVAKDNDIKYKMIVSGGGTGTDTDMYTLSNGGVISSLISIPVKYMHTPNEMASIEDVKTAIKFYVELLKNIEYQHNFKYF